MIGLIGGIGSGKSQVAAVWSELGAAVIDSDEAARRQLRDLDVIRTLCAWWGEGVLDSTGVVDRKKVADIVFADVSQKKRLEDLIYPRLAKEREVLVAQYNEDPGVSVIVLNSPLLLEAGLDVWCDVIVLVEAPRDVREQRVRDHRGWSAEELQRRESLQIPLDKKRARADHIVYNNSSIDVLREQIGLIHAQLTAS